jgi:hypothetical protein
MVEKVRYKILQDKIVIIIGDNSNELDCHHIMIKRDSNLSLNQSLENALENVRSDMESYYYLNNMIRLLGETELEVADILANIK